MIFYCDADQTGPTQPNDWTARQRAVEAVENDAEREAAQAALDAERIGLASHFARNGNGARTHDDTSAEVALAIAAGLARVVLAGEADEHGGQLASVELVDGSQPAEALRCPECLALARGVA